MFFLTFCCRFHSTNEDEHNYIHVTSSNSQAPSNILYQTQNKILQEEGQSVKGVTHAQETYCRLPETCTDAHDDHNNAV